MPDDIIPTRAALLELKEEHQMVQEGYQFLDEKRLLLAAEILRELSRYQELMREFEDLHQRAVASFIEAVAQHGLQGLQVYPPEPLEGARVHTDSRVFLGVRLIQARLAHSPAQTPPRAVYPSPEARRARRLFRTVIEQAAVIAGVCGNLFRLAAEYRRTERRARALEDVILPEIGQTLMKMETLLEEVDQEENIRTRLKYGR